MFCFCSHWFFYAKAPTRHTNKLALVSTMCYWQTLCYIMKIWMLNCIIDQIKGWTIYVDMLAGCILEGFLEIYFVNSERIIRDWDLRILHHVSSCTDNFALKGLKVDLFQRVTNLWTWELSGQVREKMLFVRKLRFWKNLVLSIRTVWKQHNSKNI